MLIWFKASNFRSIGDQIELDLRRTALKGQDNHWVNINEIPLLLSAVFYGANASGKSNVLRALKAMEYLVLRSADFKPGEEIRPYEPFRLDPARQDAPVELKMAFLADGVRYEYAISFSRSAILSERLDCLPHGFRKLLFSRSEDQPIQFGDSYRGGKRTIEQLLLPNQLFLSKAAENNVEALIPVYHFFARHLIVYPFMANHHESSLSRLYARRLAEDAHSPFSRRLNALMCALDTGIARVAATETDWTKVEFPNAMSEDVKSRFQEDFKYDIQAFHAVYANGVKTDEIPFDVREESVGTQSLLVIAGMILDALELGDTLVVDEFEKNLHPEASAYLINLFHDPVINRKHAQLILATHDVNQLSDDRFRRDQIYLTEKDEFGRTQLFRVSDIGGIRKNAPLDKWYTTGRLGGTPVINDLDFQFSFQDEKATTQG